MIINGKERDFESGTTVSEMLGRLSLDESKVVVEVNYEIVEKGGYSGYELNASDKIEIIAFVGGG